MTVALEHNPGDATLGGTLTAPIVERRRHVHRLDSQPARHRLYLDRDRHRHRDRVRRPAPITVTPASNTTDVAVTASPTAPIFGQSVTLTATVSVISPGTGVPTGTVTFDEGSTTLGTVDLRNGVASLITTPTAAGAETITVDFSGDVNDQPSSTTLALTIGKATPTLTWADPATITAGTPLTDAQLDATASFDGTILPGLFIYSPPAAPFSLRERPDSDSDFPANRCGRLSIGHGLRRDRRRPGHARSDRQRTASVQAQDQQ